MKRIACIIPTYNGKEDLKRLCSSLENQSIKFDLFIVDSSSSDGSCDVAAKFADGVHVIAANQFNHGGTRQLMVDLNPSYDIYVFMTQDAYLPEPDSIAKLVDAFADPNVGAVCGRQLPHLDAHPLARHARAYNYPDQILIKTMDDVTRLGIKTAFMSNSFAAYRKEALASVGGFPVHVIFAEDMYVAARMLMAGWRVAYAGNAACRHSHNYSIREEFSRYFDMGVFHSRERWIRESFGGAGGEGLRYVVSELRFLGLSGWYVWPEAIFRNAIKLVGYKLGQQEARLPVSMKRKLGMYKRYWDGAFASQTGR